MGVYRYFIRIIFCKSIIKLKSKIINQILYKKEGNLNNKMIKQEPPKGTNPQKTKVIANKYTLYLNSQLGKGSFATTYLCKLKSDPNQLLACKSMNKQQTKKIINDLEYLIKRVKQQVNAWKQLHHPNIVKFQGCQETKNNIYFFLEYCPDGSLQSYINKNKFSLNTQQVFSFAKQLIAAVAYLESKNIVHRDIKPDNIMLNGNQIKLGDFGLARAVKTDESQQYKASFFTFAGTLHYMAPQIIRCQKNPYKCDVWSVGVTIYLMFTSQLPFGMQFKDQSQKVILQKIQLAKQQFKQEVFQKNPHIRQVLSKMLNPNQKQRPKMSQILQQINKL